MGSSRKGDKGDGVQGSMLASPGRMRVDAPSELRLKILLNFMTREIAPAASARAREDEKELERRREGARTRGVSTRIGGTAA